METWHIEKLISDLVDWFVETSRVTDSNLSNFSSLKKQFFIEGKKDSPDAVTIKTKQGKDIKEEKKHETS